VGTGVDIPQIVPRMSFARNWPTPLLIVIHKALRCSPPGKPCLSQVPDRSELTHAQRWHNSMSVMGIFQQLSKA